MKLKSFPRQSFKYVSPGNLRFFAIVFLLLPVSDAAKSQSLAGVTGKPDTSYTSYSAYLHTKKSHPGIAVAEVNEKAAVAEEKNIAYCAVNGRELLLDAFYPADKRKSNGISVMIIHGGGWRSGNRSQHYPLARRLADLGYTCFTPEYRLSTEALYPAAINDLKTGIKWIRQHAAQYGGNGDKIVAAGFSAGGELAAFLGTTNGNKIFDGSGCRSDFSADVQAIVDIDGTLSFIHPESGEGDDSKGISAATYWFGYPKKENPELWKQASPLTHAGQHTPPTLFLNSAVERMHAGRNDYVQLLSQHNIYTEVKTFEEAPHSFCLFHPWFEPTVAHIDKFLKTVFKK